MFVIQRCQHVFDKKTEISMYLNVYLKLNYNARFINSDRYICFKRTYFSKE